MKNRLLLIGLFSLVASALCAQAPSNVIDEVVWIVGDEPILKSDVENARVEALRTNQQVNGDINCIIPEQLAVQKLFLHQAQVDSIIVSDSEVYQSVDGAIADAITQMGSSEALEDYLGKTIDEIRELWYTPHKDQITMSRVQQSLMKDVRVTPSQVRRHFSDMPEDSLPFIPTKVECQIITREPRIPQEEIDRVKDELRGYTERVNKGEIQFSTLAMMYSEDKASAVKGGELGFQGRGRSVPEFSNVAFSMTDPKAISKVFETEYGFHIIQFIEKRGDLVNCRHILRKPRVSADSLQVCINDLDSIAKEIKEGKYTFDECVRLISYDKTTRNNYGLMMNSEHSSKFEMQELPREVASAVVGMKEGDISAPFIMTNSQGKDVVAMVKLKSRTDGHRATVTEDFQVLQGVLVQKMCEEKLDRWVREKQKTTYVRINEGWQNCEFQYPGWVK